MNPEVTHDFATESTNTNASSPSPSGNSSGLADTVSGVVSQIQEQVAPAVSQTQQKASDLAGKVQQQATSRIDEHKSQAAGSLGSVAQALRQSSQQVREQDQGIVTQYAGQYGDVVADQVERVSNYLQDHSTQDLVQEVETFARREPALFIGGAFLLGLLGARLLKSAPPTSASTSTPAPSPAPASSGTSQSSTETLALPLQGAANGSTSPGNSDQDDLSLLPVSVTSDPFYDVDDPGVNTTPPGSTPERNSSLD